MRHLLHDCRLLPRLFMCRAGWKHPRNVRAVRCHADQWHEQRLGEWHEQRRDERHEQRRRDDWSERFKWRSRPRMFPVRANLHDGERLLQRPSVLERALRSPLHT